MYALNFYSPVFAEQLRQGRKTATIRLGDKRAKYEEGKKESNSTGREP